MHRFSARPLIPFALGIAAAVLGMGLAGRGSYADTRYEELSLFTNVMSLVRSHYVEPVDERALVTGAVRGILSELDPHSSFMDAEAYAEMQIDTRGEFEGLGIEISKHEDGSIEVVSPIEGTPAAEAGLRARDRIVAICPTEKPEDWTEPCRGTQDLSLFEAVQLMRGRRGSAITVEIMREGFERPRPFRIVRGMVKIVSAEGRSLEPGYGYVRVRAFQERTHAELRDALRKVHKENPDGLGDSCSTCGTTRAGCSIRR
ncbi:MAG: PDZ domain-containing protein [Proteobacteria bacterium]|nr:PDZ domain-containing protein [Pseudomonadota bacterium]